MKLQPLANNCEFLYPANLYCTIPLMMAGRDYSMTFGVGINDKALGVVCLLYAACC